MNGSWTNKRWGVIAIINAISLSIGLVLGTIFGTVKFGWLGVNPGLTMVVIQTVYMAASLKRIGPTEQGALLLFLRPIANLESGLHFIPWGICQLAKETRNAIQMTFPEESGNVWMGISTIAPPGATVPLRVTHASNPSGKEILDRQQTTEEKVIVRFFITDLCQFLRAIGSVAEAKRQLRATVAATLRECLATKSVAKTLATWGEVNNLLLSAVEILVGERTRTGNPSVLWGVNVDDVRLEEIDLGATLNKSLRDVPDAQLQRTVTETNAEAEKRKRSLEGEGDAAAIKATGKAEATARQALLFAEAEGYDQVATKLGIQRKEFVLAIRAAQVALENANYSWFTGEGSLQQIFAAVSAFGTVKSTGPKAPEPAPQAEGAGEEAGGNNP